MIRLNSREETGHAEPGLQRRIVHEVAPKFARALLENRRQRLGIRSAPTNAELEQIRQGTFALLFRALFHLHAKTRGLILPLPALPNERIATVVERLSFDYQFVSVRQLGSLYESLLEYRLRIAGGNPYLASDKSGRKATGSFYTPEPIVRYIVEHTVGPVLSRHLQSLPAGGADMFGKLFDFKVIDPAMGSGHFLVEAANFLTSQILQFLVARKQPTDVRPLKRRVLERCIHGVDSDPLAAELTKMSLWLDASATDLPLEFLDRNVRVGDSLNGALDQDAGGFDAILCNPPYSGHKGDFDSRQLTKRFPVCRRYANPATAFSELATRLCKPGGAFGLIVPKSIQYVEAWQDARTLLAEHHALDQLLDVSQAFDDVLLEQSILIGRKSPPQHSYLAGVMRPTGSPDLRKIPRIATHTLPAAVEPESLGLFDHISRLGPRLADISCTSQALAYQAKLNCGDRARSIPIHRGRQIRPMRIDPPTDWIDRAHLIKSDGQYTSKVAAMLRPKIVSQNIIAHLTKPRPRIWIIAAPDPAGILCLNTVSTTIVRDERFPIAYIAAVLNSTLASWFYNEFVFCRAVRTMHFDNFYAGKLPIAVPTQRTVQSCRALASRCAATESRHERQQLIDAIAFRAYRLSESQQAFLRLYCYGPLGPHSPPIG